MSSTARATSARPRQAKEQALRRPPRDQLLRDHGRSLAAPSRGGICRGQRLRCGLASGRRFVRHLCLPPE
eukprot:15320310-Alexandrium_andersonii.AAC.1